ncbi:biosynthetic-type acetolactate synthase large subunit [Anaerophilus nitritogenes]|uniref:biosynthetic-type acetolactate synthase large subunit n=1 Tax=Anaerophilus nitritogenes TaxID=2498136 RepID=UPI003C12C0F4
MKLNGSEILLECLLEQGVDTIFGYPGGAVLNIYDALYKYSDKIKHYLTSHEQGASHAADGYSRATGKVGVCLATSGPGATNLVTGIATAYADSVPLIAITGNVGVASLGKDSFQEVDIQGITMSITKHNFIVRDVNMLAETIRKAFYIAQSNKPGPVLIDITKDVTSDTCEYEYKKPKKILPRTKTIKQNDLLNAIKLICKSKKPIIFAGGGIISSKATEELIKFAELIDSPVTLSTMGLGGFPASNIRYTGMLGMHGSKASNLSVMECDLFIALGTRFSDRVSGNTSQFAKNSKILHIDIDPAEINKNIFIDQSVIGDLKEILKRLNSMLTKQDHKDWNNQVNQLKLKYPLTYKKDEQLKPQYIMEKINEITKGQAIITTDVGQHQMWACQYIKHEKPRHLITSGGMGTMGFGLGASIGASIGNPDKIIMNITGDGCFRMNCIEIATAVEYNIPVIILIMNNHALGMVRQWQSIFYDSRYSYTTLNKTTDFVKLAQAYNAEAFHITEKSQVEEILRKAISLKKPVVINFEIDCDEKVFPMIPANSNLDHFITENSKDLLT